MSKSKRRNHRKAARAGFEDMGPALQRAWNKVEEGMVGFVNVKANYRARAVPFSSRET